MSAKRCPLCGGALMDGECVSCGYVLPDDEAIAAPYDLDPSNDLFGEAAREYVPDMETLDISDIPQTETPQMSSIMPMSTPPYAAARQAQQMQYQSPPIQPAPNIKVRQSPPPAVQPQNPPRTPPPAQPVYQPVRQPNNQQTGLFEQVVKGVSNFVQKHWWKFLLLLLVPSAGLILAIAYFAMGHMKDTDKFRNYAFAAVFFFGYIFLSVKGFDIFGLDEILQEILDSIFL